MEAASLPGSVPGRVFIPAHRCTLTAYCNPDTQFKLKGGTVTDSRRAKWGGLSITATDSLSESQRAWTGLGKGEIAGMAATTIKSPLHICGAHSGSSSTFGK